MTDNEGSEESSVNDPPPSVVSYSSSEEGMYEEDSPYRSLSPVPIVNIGSPCTEGTSATSSPQRTPSPVPPLAYPGTPADGRDEVMQMKFANFSSAQITESRRMRAELLASWNREQLMENLIEVQGRLIQHMGGRVEELQNLLYEAIRERNAMDPHLAQATEDTDSGVADPVFIAKLILQALKASLYISVALLIVVPAMRPLLPSAIAVAFVLLVVVWLLQAFTTDEVQQAQTYV